MFYSAPHCWIDDDDNIHLHRPLYIYIYIDIKQSTNPLRLYMKSVKRNPCLNNGRRRWQTSYIYIYIYNENETTVRFFRERCNAKRHDINVSSFLAEYHCQQGTLSYLSQKDTLSGSRLHVCFDNTWYLYRYINIYIYIYTRTQCRNDRRHGFSS